MLTAVDMQRAISPLREKVVRVPGTEAKPSSHAVKNNLVKEPKEIVERGFLDSLFALEPEEEQRKGRGEKRRRKGASTKDDTPGNQLFQTQPSVLQNEEKGHLIDLSV